MFQNNVYMKTINLSYMFQNNVYMKTINLSWNGFGLEGAIGLQDALKTNSVLEELDISYVTRDPVILTSYD